VWVFEVTAAAVELQLKVRILRHVAGDPDDDDPFIVLTETKFSSRCIPVWIGTLLTGLGSKKKHM